MLCRLEAIEEPVHDVYRYAGAQGSRGLQKPWRRSMNNMERYLVSLYAHEALLASQAVTEALKMDGLASDW